MVRRGEYLERAVAIPGRSGTLEGLYHRGARRPALLIAPMHPFGGGSMESPIVAELAWAVTRRGHATLRFNYRGVGASSGSFTDDQAALMDLADAAEHLRATTSHPALAVAGLGYGAVIAAAAALADDAIETLVAVAPDPGALPPALEAHPREVVLVVSEAEDREVKAALARLAARLRSGRLAVVPGADRAFVRGLVELGRVVADAVSPPGFVDIEGT